jgi:HSP20 family protein
VKTNRRSLEPMDSLRRLNHVLDEAFTSWPLHADHGTITSAWVPAVDVFEDKESVKIVAELPGVTPENVKLSIENNVLTIRGEKKQEAEENSDRVRRYERTFGSFERAFALPNSIDAEKIDAGYADGVLTVTIPKAEKARPREIPVRSTPAATR